MIEIKTTRSWIFIHSLDKDPPIFPCKPMKVKDDIYRIPNTIFNFNYVTQKNTTKDLNKIKTAWKEEYIKYDNKNLKKTMEYLKLNEEEVVEKIKESHKAHNIKLWPFLYKHQIICTHLCLQNNGYGLFLDMGAGKAQSLNSLILTPKGWVRMGNINIGDLVINPEGGTSLVEGIYPQGVKKVYEVVLFDGGRTRCCEDHLWKTKLTIDIHKLSEKIRTTKEVKELVDNYKTAKKGARRTVCIPINAPVEFASQTKTLIINPYILGLLLGNGSFTKASVQFHYHSEDEELIQKFRQEKIEINEVYYRPKSKAASRYIKNMKKQLEELQLMGKRSWEKFIPKEYLTSSIESRTQLLQGLMDTDGTIGSNGRNIEYSTASIQLAKDIQELARSLGHKTKLTIKERPVYTTKEGIKKIGKPSYRIYITSENPESLFNLTRKKEKVKTKYVEYREEPLSRKIKEVNFIGYEECQCIKLNSENGLYITDDYIVTHNTITSLQISKIRMDKDNTEATLIVSPANIMRPVWEKQIEDVNKWAKENFFKCEVLDGTYEERVRQLKTSKANVFILNYEMLMKLLPELINKRFNMLIFDESTRIKNPQAQATKAAQELSKRARYKLILSGTPIANKELDIHSQLNTIQLSSLYNPLPLNYYAFKNTYFAKAFNRPFAPWILRRDRREELNNAIYSMAIKYSRYECKELPPVVTQIIPCQMTKDQAKAYVSLKDKVLTEIKGKAIKAQIALTKLLRLSQVTSGFSVDIHGNTVKFDVQPKLDTVCELVEEIPDKVIIFCRFVETIKELKRRLGDQAVEYYGEINKTEKNKNLHKFEHDNKKVLIAQIQSGGVGLNLQYASYIIFCETDWSSMNYEQAVARIQRDGQKADKCTVYVCMCPETIDQHLYEVIKEKKSSADKVLKTVMKGLKKK